MANRLEPAAGHVFPRVLKSVSFRNFFKMFPGKVVHNNNKENINFIVTRKLS